MLKELGVLAGGVFLGALTAEIISRKCPDAGNRLLAKTREIAANVKESFNAGYANAMRAQDDAESVPVR